MFPRTHRPCEATSLEPFELLGDCLLDDRGHVPIGRSRAQQGAQSLQLVVELGTRGELYLVAARRQRLDD
jgi:hypothetical protein